MSDYTTLPQVRKVHDSGNRNNGNEVYNGARPTTSLENLLTGNYTVKASYGLRSDEGFDKPCLTGDISVTGGGTTNVTIPVTLAKSLIVRMGYSDNFKTYYTDYSIKLTTGAGTEVDFPKGEDRAALRGRGPSQSPGTLTN